MLPSKYESRKYPKIETAGNYGLHRTRYHRSILSKPDFDIDGVKVDHEFLDSKGGILNGTLFDSDSETGILIIPGIWYPREAYYKLSQDLCRKYKVAVYDQRGHSRSSSDFNLLGMIEDVAVVAAQFRACAAISQLFIVGHSLGGYVCAIASTEFSDGLIDGQVLLAAPLSLNTTGHRVPGELTIFKVYLAGLLKALTPKYRSFIVREYVSFWYPVFKKRPHLFALRADNPKHILKQIKTSIDLKDFGDRIFTPSLFVWPGNDRTLGIIQEYPGDYQEFINNFVHQNSIIDEVLIPGLCHQFNFNSKHSIMISSDNDIAKNRIDMFIRNGGLS